MTALKSAFNAKSKSSTCLLIAKPDLAVHFQLTDTDQLITPQFTELDPALSLADQTAWQQLARTFPPSSFKDGCIILHPELYLVQTLADKHQPQVADSLFRQQVRLGNHWLDYYRDACLTECFPQCSYIVPCLELVRSYAAVNRLQQPWIITNSEHLWITDTSGRIHELAVEQQSQIDWLLHSLLAGNCITTESTCLADQQTSAKQLSQKGFTNISTDQQIATTLTLFSAVSGIRLNTEQLQE